MKGLKNVHRRHEDALSRIAWDDFERLVADYYRGQGYRVMHVGTGGNSGKFDGGIDLKLFKGDVCTLVQCKHWNAKQVTHNAVHELLGIMINERASAAILICSGEFTRAATEAAQRHGHVQLIDGVAVRAMLGPVDVVMDSSVRSHDDSRDVITAKSFAVTAGLRLLSAAEDRIRGGPRDGQHKHHPVSNTVRGALTLMAMKLFTVGVVVVLFIIFMIFGFRLFENSIRHLTFYDPLPMQATSPAPVNQRAMPYAAEPAMNPEVGHDDRQPMPAEQQIGHAPTAAEIRESHRKADEAMRVIKTTTPEM